MKPIIIFGGKIQGKDCPWCLRARALVERRGLKHVYFDTTSDLEKRAELNERLPDHKTVPQIFVGPVHIGGFTDLAAADRTGRLQQLIAGE